MLSQNRKASAAYKLVLAACGTAGLLGTSGVLSGYPSSTFLLYFTNLSNIAVACYLWGAGIAELRGVNEEQVRPWHGKVKHALMLAITVTGIVAHFMLNGGGVMAGGTFHWEMLLLHYVVPVGMIADWLLFDRKGTMTKAEPPTWTFFPLAYVVYIYVMVLGLGFSCESGVDFGNNMPASRFPYPFLDVDTLGAGGVVAIIVVLIVVFVALGYVYVLIDRKLASKRVQQEN